MGYRAVAPGGGAGIGQPAALRVDKFTFKHATPPSLRAHKETTKGLTATVEVGEDLGTFVSAGRVIAGGVLLGGAGLALGALIRKNHTRGFLLVHRDGVLVAANDFSAKHLAKAQHFADTLNRSAADPANPGE